MKGLSESESNGVSAWGRRQSLVEEKREEQNDDSVEQLPKSYYLQVTVEYKTVEV